MFRRITPKLAEEPVTSKMQFQAAPPSTPITNVVNPRPRKRCVPTVDSRDSPVSPASIDGSGIDTMPSVANVKPGPKTRIEIVDGKSKSRPTGDHVIGYGRPPAVSQFKAKNKGGGRPKGSKSQATLEREALNKKYAATRGGRKRMVAARELIVEKMVTTVLTTKNYKDMRDLSDRAARLHPDQPQLQPQAVYDPIADLGVLEQAKALLSLGEPGDEVDPFADVATGRPDLGDANASDGWSEGDWDQEDKDDDHGDA